MINELAKQIHENNKAKGFYEEVPLISTRIALIHSEASEALEADRKGKRSEFGNVQTSLIADDDSLFKAHFEFGTKDTFEDELADIVIRVFDLAAEQGIDIENHIKAKVRYNTLRPYKHGKNY